MNTSLLTRPVRRTLATTATVLAVLAGPVGTAHALEGDHLVDQDRVSESVSGRGQVYGDSYLFVRNGRVQHSMAAGLDSYVGGCVAARATYVYADGTTGTQTSARACKARTAHLAPSFSSSPSKDLVKYVYELLYATDTTAPLSKISGSTHLVGDHPDSLGTKERLDHDEYSMFRNGEKVADVTSDYSVRGTWTPAGTFWDVRNRVSGTLTWSRQLRGSYAAVQVRWHFADGAEATATSARLLADHGSIAFDLSSPLGRDVVAVQVSVVTDVSGGGVAGLLTKFGDFGGVM